MQSASDQQCDVLELNRAMQSTDQPLLLDVREKWEYEICCLPNALNIPMTELPKKIDELPRDRDIVVYCHHGVRSLQASALIRMAGLNRAISLRGGIDAWANQIDPTMKKY